MTSKRPKNALDGYDPALCQCDETTCPHCITYRDWRRGPTPAELAADHSRPADQRQAGGDHYKRMGIQPWAVIDTWPRDQRIGFYRASALAYLMRLGSKGDDPAVEAEKAMHYCQKLAEVIREADPTQEVQA